MRYIYRITVLLAAGLASLAAAAQSAAPSVVPSLADLDYIELKPPAPTSDPDRIVVTEFFSYQCPHCYAFDPELRHWVAGLPEDVVFDRVPTALGRPAWEPIAQAFYALEAMGQLEAVDLAIFRAIHVEHVALYDKASIVEWLGAHGIDTETFSRVYDGFGVKVAMSRGEEAFDASRILSVPALTVDGKYRVLIEDNGAFAEQLAAVGVLIDRVREAKRQ
jgi:thiol:disulfide interchange protein DsbA